MQLPDSARRPGNGDDSLIPLINVVFLMLVFFMIAGKITATDAFKVQPPSAQVQQPAPADALVVLVAADGRIAVDGEETTLEQLAGRLEALLAPAAQAAPTAPAEAAATDVAAPATGDDSEIAAPAPAEATPSSAPLRKVALKVDGALKASELNGVLDALRAAGVGNAELFTVRNGGPAS